MYKFDPLGLSLGMILLRIWLALRAILSGVEKYASLNVSSSDILIDGAINDYGLSEAIYVKSYALENYNGVPSVLYDKFLNEPLIPSSILYLFNSLLGPSFIVLGLALLIGFATRSTLFLMGILYTSLTLGLILIKQDSGVAWLGIHILMIIAALSLVKYNRFVVCKKW